MLPLRWYNDRCSCTQTDLKEGKESFFVRDTEDSKNSQNDAG